MSTHSWIRHVYQPSSSKVQGASWESRQKSELDDGEGCYEMPSLGHGTAVKLMNSQQQWSPAQHETRKNSIVDEEGSHRIPPLVKESWLHSFRNGNSFRKASNTLVFYYFQRELNSIISAFYQLKVRLFHFLWNYENNNICSKNISITQLSLSYLCGCK